ncbi:MAG: LolA family protein [Terriglobales bacterium]
MPTLSILHLRRAAVLLAVALTLLMAPAAAPAESELEPVLDRMDATAAAFRSAQADFVWDQYQKVVDETDTQKGRVFFRRRGSETEMAADIFHPDRKYVLFTGGKVRVYQPRIDQVTEYQTGKNREEVESFLILGFGGRGHDLLKSFEVRYVGAEGVDGRRTAVIELIPRSQKARGVFNRILLWIDLEHGISLKQQLFEPSGDHRTARYTGIRMNEKIPDDAFRLKTTGKTRVVSPEG